jgi:hypothetical protein
MRLSELLYHKGIDMTGYKEGDRVIVSVWGSQMWNELDAMLPCDGFANVHHGERTIGKLKLFNYTESPKEIYLPPSSVDECLNRILQLQYPEQKLIKSAEVKKPIIQAKIYSLAA